MNKFIQLCVIAGILVSSGIGPAASLSMTKQERQSKVILQVKSSPDAVMESSLEINSPKLLKAFHKSTRAKTGYVPVTDRSLTFGSGGITYTFALDKEGRVFDYVSKEEIRISPAWNKALKDYGDRLSREHYGELLDWKEAKQLIPVKRKFMVKDLETGQSFHVQRRAGSSHADVQPLTAKDTGIMKRIYNGEWSWKRRAILVESDKGWLAASMHGMPHGGDGIPGNEFNGHFCIHFRNSVTHKSDSKDPGHQLMVHKAAGQLDEYLHKLNPYELVDSWIAAVHLQQLPLMGYFFREEDSDEWNNLINEIQSVKSIRRTGAFPEPLEPSLMEQKDKLVVTIVAGVQGEGRAVNRKLIFHMDHLEDGAWIIDKIEGLSTPKKAGKERSNR